MQVGLNELVEFMTRRREDEAIESGLEGRGEVEGMPPLPIQDMSPEQLLLELTLPLGKSTRRTAMTDRPKTDRKRPVFNQSTISRLE
jgi:hypothetical protein